MIYFEFSSKNVDGYGGLLSQLYYKPHGDPGDALPNEEDCLEPMFTIDERNWNLFKKKYWKKFKKWHIRKYGFAPIPIIKDGIASIDTSYEIINRNMDKMYEKIANEIIIFD